MSGRRAHRRRSPRPRPEPHRHDDVSTPALPYLLRPPVAAGRLRRCAGPVLVPVEVARVVGRPWASGPVLLAVLAWPRAWLGRRGRPSCRSPRPARQPRAHARPLHTPRGCGEAPAEKFKPLHPRFGSFPRTPKKQLGAARPRLLRRHRRLDPTLEASSRDLGLWGFRSGARVRGRCVESWKLWFGRSPGAYESLAGKTQTVKVDLLQPLRSGVTGATRVSLHL